LAVELHEDEVPELEESPCFRPFNECILREFLALDFGPFTFGTRRNRKILGDVGEVDKDLGARPARTGVGHLPEIIVRTQAIDARIRKPCDLTPERTCFVVFFEDADTQVLRRKLEFLRHELPGKLDRIALEVIAERKVAEHLEERVMPGGVADLLQIVVLSACSYALLYGRGATTGRGLFLAEEYLLELDHPSVGEQDRRVVGGHHR